MTDTKIIGFDNPNEVDSDDGYNNNVPSEIKSKKKGAGAFGCMGLSQNVLKGITANGYKRPTPIQRKVNIFLINNYLYLLTISHCIFMYRLFHWHWKDEMLLPWRGQVVGRRLVF